MHWVSSRDLKIDLQALCALLDFSASRPDRVVTVGRPRDPEFQVS